MINTLERLTLVTGLGTAVRPHSTDQIWSSTLLGLGIGNAQSFVTLDTGCIPFDESASRNSRNEPERLAPGSMPRRSSCSRQ